MPRNNLLNRFKLTKVTQMKTTQLMIMVIAPMVISTLPLVSSAAPVPKLDQIPTAITNKAQTIVGNFVKAEKETTGTARIIMENGHRYLELDNAFSTSNQGPDLHILLDPTPTPTANYPNQGSVINLGRLKSYQGTQRYPIPDVINLDNYKSVAIWCRMANATFGYATLSAY
jgi:Electron transfer DM13